MLQRKNGHTGPSPIYLPGSSTIQRHVAGFKWFLRRLLGKLLSVLRLMKAAFTFHNGTQYILWKIERHTGVSIEVSNWQKRHPILASTTLFWRLYRNGAFK